jgi:hypothetical protein
MTAAAAHSKNGRANRRERRKQPRKGTLWHGKLRTPAGVVACRVLNLSARGAKLELDVALAPGQSVTLIMEPLGEFSGAVTWQRDGRAGIRINEHRTTRTEITLPRSLASKTFPE